MPAARPLQHMLSSCAAKFSILHQLCHRLNVHDLYKTWKSWRGCETFDVHLSKRMLSCIHWPISRHSALNKDTVSDIDLHSEVKSDLGERSLRRSILAVIVKHAHLLKLSWTSPR